MMIEPRKPDATREKEIKVKIPVTYLLKLHALKLHTGKQISTAVEEALDNYFASDQPLERSPPR